VIPVLVAGLILNLACIAIALSGTDVAHFVASMFVLGVGWNFLFTAGTSLSLKAYRSEERDKTQGAINFCVFGMMMISSFSSGALVTTQGWRLLSYVSLLLVAATGFAVLWYAVQHHPRRAALHAE
jgi:MFS family permease